MSDHVITTPVAQPTASDILGYESCDTCGTILGYKAKVGHILYLYLYAYPPAGVCPNLAERRVCGRMLDGDLHCSHCDTWQEWCAAAERPWEKRRPG
jgi:hypothetical protein